MKNRWRRFRNWYRHRLRLNTGRVTSWTDPDGRIWIAFFCECGELHDVSDITEIVPQYVREES